ncbi:MAG TPA: hypothetical protein VFR85_17870 [Anaeromyxobacteraceae bacterium]|nr:hypothetical protein [Anaeromyxobacteraceae bacterium]
MAVKVMVAPAIANGEVRSERRARQPRPPGAPEKPRRRRSSVYDADGNEVFITLMCLKCHKMKPLGQFGLRRMADGAIRNQPWCRPCRSASGADRPRRAGEAAVHVDPVAAAEPATPVAAPAQKPIPASAIAAQVAAAIVWNK